MSQPLRFAARNPRVLLRGGHPCVCVVEASYSIVSCSHCMAIEEDSPDFPCKETAIGRPGRARSHDLSRTVRLPSVELPARGCMAVRSPTVYTLHKQSTIRLGIVARGDLVKRDAGHHGVSTDACPRTLLFVYQLNPSKHREHVRRGRLRKLVLT